MNRVLYHFRFDMLKWQNGFLGVSKAAALGWAEALASAAIFQKELHHFYHFKSEVVLSSSPDCPLDKLWPTAHSRD